jgi:hypothetical protein
VELTDIINKINHKRTLCISSWTTYTSKYTYSLRTVYIYVCMYIYVCTYYDVSVWCGVVRFIQTSDSTPVISLIELLNYDWQELSSLSIEHISVSQYIKDATCVI